MSWPLRTSLSIENSKDGHKGYSLKRCDVPSPSSIPDKLKRKKTGGLTCSRARCQEYFVVRDAS
jgi:hypothetical protein